jgi:predicted metal-dependent hydrolase
VIEKITKIYKNVLVSIDSTQKTSGLKVEFYPYVGLSNRIRRRDGLFSVRISDVLHDAPIEFHKALAQILIRKLFRRKISVRDLEIYREYLKQSSIHEKTVEIRRERGRKIITTAKGEAYDLNEIFLFLNQIYFKNKLPKPVLTWSVKKTFSILGHHDSAHKTVVISKSLDDRRVPRFVVEYVVYHEMLHIKHPTEHRNGRRYNHTPAFRRDEEAFAYFEEAERWIEDNVNALKREIKKATRKTKRK